MHYAAADANDWAIASFLDHGIDPNVADMNGWTPLHFTAQNHSLRAAELLLAAGASPDAQDKQGNTALWVAVINSRGRGGMIRTLLDHGANPDLAHSSGVTARALASRIANYDVAWHFD